MRASLWNSVNGYVKIQIEGLSQEKLLNLAAQKRLSMWDVRRITYTQMSAYLSVASFKKLRRIVKKTGCKVHLLEKKGVPFLLNRFRFRQVLLYGAVVFLAMLYAISLYVWEIEIQGTQKVDPKEILQVVEKRFPKRTLRFKLDMSAIENDVVRSDSRIAWAGARLVGTTLIVEVVEGVLPPEMVDKETPASIVSAKDAMIYKLTVLEGRTMVEEGQKVKEGDVLINGFYEGKESAAPRLVHSRGIVMGRTWYTATVKMEKMTTVKQKTGKTQKVGRIRVAGLDVSTHGDDFAQFESESASITRLNRLYLPLEFEWERQYELADVVQEQNQDQMQAQLEKTAWEQVEQLLPKDARMVDKSIEFFPTETGMLATITVEMLEDIGKTVPVAQSNFETPPPDNA